MKKENKMIMEKIIMRNDENCMIMLSKIHEKK